MKQSIKLVFFLVGFLLLGWAIYTVDLTAVANLLIELGSGLIIILLIYGSVTWVDTIAWKKCFKLEEARHFRLWDLWCIRSVGEAYNTITPLGTLGGEPVKSHGRVARRAFRAVTVSPAISSSVTSWWCAVRGADGHNRRSYWLK